MATTFATPLAEARALLNDPTGAIYQDVPMIALGAKVYRELQTKLSALGISTTKEVSSAITVTAGITEMLDGGLLPADLLYPTRLYERPSGSVLATDYVEMDETDWPPNIIIGNVLNFWQWREESLKFPGATVDVKVLIFYIKSLGTITSTGSSIQILNSTSWIAQRLASIAALVLGSSPAKAAALDADLNKEGGVWDDLKATVVKRKQNVPVRRKRTRFRVL